jgi:hypothetical protein
MKNIAAAFIIGGIANINFPFLPKVSLLVIMSGAMACDLILGLLRAKLAGIKITEKGLTRTIIKFCQYGGAIFLGLGISYLSMEVSKFNDTWKYTPQFMSFMNNSLLVYIITIEVRSCVKHLIGLDSKSEISTTLLGPVLKVLSIQIKKNPVVQITMEAASEDDEDEMEVVKTVIKSPNIKP